MLERIDCFIKYLLSRFERIVYISLVALFFIILLLFFLPLDKKAPIREDAVGYYAYLPAVFIYQDINFDFLIEEGTPYTQGVNSFERKFNPEEAKIMGFNEIEEGKYIDKYPIGVSLMLIPFFIFGHVLSILFGESPNGWSFFYQYISFFGGVFYFLFGLVFLKKVLRKYFSDTITLFTLFAITFGTNLFNYAFYENVYSHVYSFFLISLILFIVDKWTKKMNFPNSLILGATFGMIVSVRFTNAVLVLLPILYGVISCLDVMKQIKKFISKWKYILTAIIFAFIIFLPQLLYWKIASDNWIIYSYEGEGFNFLKPEFCGVLFSVQKGLFFWSPVLIFAAVGIFFLRKKAKKYFLPVLIILFIQIYIVSCWWNWRYGWSFGHRAFVDFLPLFSLGLGAFYSSLRARYIKYLIFGISIVFIILSSFQMIQYWLRILPPEYTTFEDYKTIFLKLDKDLRYFWESKY